jgi:hypothetical protein
MQDLVFEKLGGREGKGTSCAKVELGSRGNRVVVEGRGLFGGYIPRGEIGRWALMSSLRVQARLVVDLSVGESVSKSACFAFAGYFTLLPL